MVEFALISSVLAFLLLGLIDVGRLYITVQALDGAAGEGATYASIHPTQTAVASQRAVDEGEGSMMLEAGQMHASIVQPPVVTPGSLITATVSYTFRPMFPIFSGTTVALSRSAVATILDDQ